MGRAPLRIGIFTDTYYPTINGVSASTQYFAEELSRRGHEVFVFCPRYKGSANEPKGEGVGAFAVLRCPAFPTPTNAEHSFSFPSLGFGVDLDSLGLDVVHIQAPFIMGMHGRKVARRLGVPLTQTYHTFWEHYLHYFVVPTFISRPIMVAQNAWLCNESAVNFVPSPQMIEGLRRYGVRSRLVVCPTGIDAGRMRSEVDAVLRDSHLGFPPGSRIVLFASRMCREKSADIALKAFALVAREIPESVLVMTGDGPIYGQIRRLAGSLGLGDRVRVLGYLPRPELYAHYAACEIFLFPSVSETQGLVVLEAQAFGKPVVGVGEMGVKMIIGDDVGGLLAHERDPAEIAGLCLRLLRDGDIYAEKSRQAEENASKWRMSEYAALMEEELYRAIDDART
jgi:1,2-diacylglycerol 3-alpha-glucosyltransferase